MSSIQKKLTYSHIPAASGTPTSMVIFLHGYGANGDDLLSMGEIWSKDLPDTVFLGPNAPDVCEAWAQGYQWFSIRALERGNMAERERQISIAAPILSQFIDEQLKKWNIPESKLVVVGFSQGAMMAMYAMPRRKDPCAGIVAYSGMLIDGNGLKSTDVVKMPVLAIHGEADEVVPPESLEYVEKGFSEAGFDCESILRPGIGHQIDQFSFMRGLNFIQKVIE